MNNDDLYQQTLDQYNDPDYAEKYSAGIDSLVDRQALDDFIKLLDKSTRVLDVGCAAGRDSAYLHNAGMKVVGLDYSSSLINIARRKHPEIEFVQGDFTELKFENDSFDGIWCYAALVHLPSQVMVKKALSGFHRVLKTGGYILIQTKAGPGDAETALKIDKLSNQKRFFRYQQKDEFARLCEQAGFEVIKSEVFNEQDKKHAAGRDENWLLVIARKK